MSTKTYSKGEVIFRQGDFASEMYDILAGSIGIYTDYETENENELTVLKPGQFLGEMGVIEAYPRSATAVALEDGTELYVVSDAEFSDYFQDRPERLLEIMRHLSGLLRDRTEDYKAACQLRDDMFGTPPENRNKTLREKISSLLKLWNDSLAEVDCNSPYECYLGNQPYIPYWTRQ